TRRRDDGERLATVTRLRGDLEVGLRVDEHADAGAEQRLIVDEHDADHASPSAAPGAPLSSCPVLPVPIGKRARTTKSPPSRSARRTPPTSCARSRMPMMPWPPPR